MITTSTVWILAAAGTLMISAIGAEVSAEPSTPSPRMQHILDQLAKLGPKPIETLTPEEARRQPTPGDAVKALLKSEGKSTDPEPVSTVKDITVPLPDGGNIPARIYAPEGKGPFPAILYIHGGGWVIADLDVYDASPRALANATKALVLSTHYRQAPEHKFPTSHNDVFAAYQWLHKHAAELGVDATKIAVVGESAGGNMAAGICLMAKERGIALPVHQALIYPVANNDFDTPSYRQNENAQPLGRAAMMWFAKHELNSPSDGDEPFISLVDKASLQGLPPTTIVTAEIDPLRSEGELFAQKLRDSGVAVRFKNFNGVTHEFFGMGAVLPEAKEAVQFVAEGLNNALSAHGSSAVGAAPQAESSRQNIGK